MTTREPPEPRAPSPPRQPPDPQEVLAAAEAAHLAARHTVRIALDRPGGPAPAGDPGVGERETVDLRRAGLARGRSPGLRRRAPLPLAAGVAAGWAALVTLVPVAALVALVPLVEGATLAGTGPVRVAASGWLLAHGVPVQTGVGPVGLVPLALSALAVWRVARAGVHVVRARGGQGSGSLRLAGLAAVAVAVAYGGIGALVALGAGGPAWGPEVARAGLTLAGFGLVAAGYGALRATGAAAARLAVLREGCRAGLVATALVLAAGAALAGTALAVSGGPAAEVLAAYGTGVAGQAGLTLLCLVYAPNLAVWAAAYLLGPGFAVGTETVVRNSEVVLGPVPALPVLAAMPTGPLPLALGTALLAVPVVAGGVAGWLLGRSVPRWVRLVAAALLAGVVAGLALGLAAAAAGGPLGHGQLATLGPEPVPVGLVAAATVAAGTLLGAVSAALLARHRSG